MLESFVDGWDVDAFKDCSRIWNDNRRALALLACLGAELRRGDRSQPKLVNASIQRVCGYVLVW